MAAAQRGRPRPGPCTLHRAQATSSSISWLAQSPKAAQRRRTLYGGSWLQSRRNSPLRRAPSASPPRSMLFRWSRGASHHGHWLVAPRMRRQLLVKRAAAGQQQSQRWRKQQQLHQSYHLRLQEEERSQEAVTRARMPLFCPGVCSRRSVRLTGMQRLATHCWPRREQQKGPRIHSLWCILVPASFSASRILHHHWNWMSSLPLAEEPRSRICGAWTSSPRRPSADTPPRRQPTSCRCVHARRRRRRAWNLLRHLLFRGPLPRRSAAAELAPPGLRFSGPRQRREVEFPGPGFAR
mmetsp:Transcript_124940/g.364915  ORF Transcript_124940/g.364915 Transcript_124940/m.364915 type:complete len:295 (+) Transcript_124940:1045-1929(+)